MSVPVVDKPLDTVVVGECPPVVGMGRLCQDEKLDFVWQGSKGLPPKFIKGGCHVHVPRTSTCTELRVENYCPFLDNAGSCGLCSTSMTACGGATVSDGLLRQESLARR